MVNIPDRGHIVYLNFNPQAGKEQKGLRPALVLSSIIYNEKTGLMLACPITSKIKGYPFEVSLPEGLPIQGVILSDQIKNIDWKERKARYICDVSPETAEKVSENIADIMLRS